MNYYQKILSCGIGLIVLALCGCASNAGGYTDATQVEQRLVGMSEAQVIQTLGAPENQVILSDRKAWTYSDEIKALTGGSCRVSLTIKDGFVESAIVNAADLSWASFPLGSCRNILRHLR